MASQLLWIGLGNMGRGMCKNLVEKGNLDQPLMLYNRTPKRAVDLQAILPPGKTEVAPDLREAVAKASVVFLCLANDAAVKDTISTALQAKATPGWSDKLFIDCSTIHPSTTTSIATTLTTSGASFVAAPVFGPPAMADAGQLIGVLAGPAAAVARARPFFHGVTARAEILLGDAPYGHASLLKIIGNSFILNMVEQLAEGHVLAEKSGLGTASLHALLELLFPGPYVAYSNRMLGGDYFRRAEPLFAVDLARKDAAHAMSLAKAAGTRLQNAETGDGHLAVVKEHSGEKGDLAGIYGAVRKEAGLKFENDGL